jgi:hypothetical protein
MLRSLYRLVLRAHPPYFRQRFAEEMQSIFDQADSSPAAVGLLADAVLSLLRQWSLRPQFWKETPLVTVGPGTPLFSVLDNNKPRAAALVYGAVLSALVLNGVVWTMGYAWNHPIFIEFRQPVFVPPASWERKTSSVAHLEATESAESALYTDEGRVVLVFNWHAYPASDGSAVSDGSSSASTAAVSSLPGLATNSSPSSLQAYAGTYLSTSEKREEVNITVNGGGLQLEVVGVLSSPLLPGPSSGRLTCAVRHCAVTFSSNPEGTVDHIEVNYDGHEIQASRVQGAVF